jgi:hypothetical protein
VRLSKEERRKKDACSTGRRLLARAPSYSPRFLREEFGVGAKSRWSGLLGGISILFAHHFDAAHPIARKVAQESNLWQVENNFSSIKFAENLIFHALQWQD